MDLRRTALLGGTLVLAAAALVPVGPASGINTDRTGARDDRGFPAHYTDDSGLSLQPCEDGTAACLGAGRGDLRPPDGEALYWAASATLPSRRGELSVELALEAAFGERGRPIVFDRLRIRGHLDRAGRYVLRHPYGAKRFRASSPREQRNVNVTVDLGCSLARGGPCPGRITNWLRSTSPRVGYLGGGDVATRVTGGRVRNGLVLRARRGGVIGRTDRFAVVGKVAPGPAAALSRTAVDLGNRARRKDRTIRVRNLGNAPLRIRRVDLVGHDAFRLRRRASTCHRSARLPSGRSCVLVVRYRPGDRRFSAARLVVRDNTRARRHRVRLRARTAAEFSSRRRVHFTPRRVGDRSTTRRVVVQNTGVRPLRIHAVSIRGRGRHSFVRPAGPGPRCSAGSRVPPGGACAVYVAFSPRTFGRKAARLQFRTSALGSPHRVRLNGRGR